MGRVAYGDESIRRSGVPDPVYLLGAYIADEDQSDLADALSVYVRKMEDYTGGIILLARSARPVRLSANMVRIILLSQFRPFLRERVRSARDSRRCIIYARFSRATLTCIHLFLNVDSEAKMKRIRTRFP